MEEILANIALINLNRFCREHSIDYSGTHLVKHNRLFKYSLVKNENGKSIASVLFSKNSVPLYYFC
jgi:hypothetical protein